MHVSGNTSVSHARPSTQHRLCPTDWQEATRASTNAVSSADARVQKRVRRTAAAPLDTVDVLKVENELA